MLFCFVISRWDDLRRYDCWLMTTKHDVSGIGVGAAVSFDDQVPGCSWHRVNGVGVGVGVVVSRGRRCLCRCCCFCCPSLSSRLSLGVNCCGAVSFFLTMLLKSLRVTPVPSFAFRHWLVGTAFTFQASLEDGFQDCSQDGF